MLRGLSVPRVTCRTAQLPCLESPEVLLSPRTPCGAVTAHTNLPHAPGRLKPFPFLCLLFASRPGSCGWLGISFQRLSSQLFTLKGSRCVSRSWGSPCDPWAVPPCCVSSGARLSQLANLVAVNPRGLNPQGRDQTQEK